MTQREYAALNDVVSTSHSILMHVVRHASTSYSVCRLFGERTKATEVVPAALTLTSACKRVPLLLLRGLHSSTFQLNLSLFFR